VRVFYRGQSSPSGETVYEQAGPVTFCCASMCRYWHVLVGFGVLGSDRSTSRDVNLSIMRAQANGRTLTEVVPIDFCPWCGQAVECCRRK
jgi:hypothetical protein